MAGASPRATFPHHLAWTPALNTGCCEVFRPPDLPSRLLKPDWPASEALASLVMLVEEDGVAVGVDQYGAAWAGGGHVSLSLEPDAGVFEGLLYRAQVLWIEG